MKRTLGAAAIVAVAVVAWRAHERSRTTAPHDVRVATKPKTDVSAPAMPPILAPRAHPPKLLSGDLHPATKELLDEAVEFTLMRCGAMASGDLDMEADLTLLEGAAAEADVLAVPHTDYPPELVDCVRDTLVAGALTWDDDIAVVRLSLPFRQDDD